MKNQKALYFNLAGLILGAVLLIAIFTWAAPCSGQLELANGNFTAMKCVYTAKAIALISIVLLVVAVENIFKKRPAPLAYIVIGLAIILVTFTNAVGIGICVKADMSCHAMALWARIIGGLIMLDGIAMFFIKGKNDL